MKNNERYVYEEVYEIFKNKSYELLCDEYINNKTKMKCCDKEGYLYEVTLSKIVNTNETPEKFSIHNKYTIENIKHYIETNNLKCKLISSEWNGNNKNLIFKCECGSLFETTWSSFNVKNKRTCNDCSRHRTNNDTRLNYDYVYDFMSYNGLELLTNKYESNTQRLMVKCSCGKVFKDTYTNIKNRKRFKCTDCSNDERFKENIEKAKCKYFKDRAFYPCDYCDNNVLVCKPLTNRCSIYEFFKNKNRDVCGNIWSGEELVTAMDCILNKEMILNDITTSLKSKTIDDIVSLVESLAIGGKKPIKVRGNCVVCGKEVIRKKSEIYGKKYVSCSKKCKSQVITYMISDGVIPQTLTEPHIKICEILSNKGIKYINEYPLKYHSIDIYVENNFFIEIMGDYWHGHPIKYQKYEDLNASQLKDIKQDKSKHTYVKKYLNKEILYLWEDDINNNIELCKDLIELYMDRNGGLYDYNSYNYHLDNGVLKLNDICFYPYFMQL